MSHFKPGKLHVYRGDAFTYKVAVEVPPEIEAQHIQATTFILDQKEYNSQVVEKDGDDILVDVEFVEENTGNLVPGHFYQGQLLMTVDGKQSVVHTVSVKVSERLEVSP